VGRAYRLKGCRVRTKKTASGTIILPTLTELIPEELTDLDTEPLLPVPTNKAKYEHALVYGPDGTVTWQTTTLATNEVKTTDVTPVAVPDDADADDDESSVADVQALIDGSLDTMLDAHGLFTRHIVLEKVSGRTLAVPKLDTQVANIMMAGLNAERVRRGWSVRMDVNDAEREALGIEPTRDNPSDGRYTVVGSPSDGWVYTVGITLECRPKMARRSLPLEAENAIALINGRAKLKENRFRVAYVDGRPYIEGETQKETSDPNEELGYAPFDLPDVKHASVDECREWQFEYEQRCDCWLSNFTHLYGLEDYIAIIRSVLELAMMSDWKDRVNIALIGPPACGKTELCKAVKAAVGDEAVLEYDATSTTMAGAQESIGQMEELPRVLVLEEIEKAPEAALPWLLSVLDLRGEVRKKTVRSDIAKSVHMIGVCTVNDEAKFNSVASGALASRFSMPLYFQRPPREILWRILKREVDKIGGDIRWIDAALDFAEELQSGKSDNLYIDPRKLIAICLTGRDRLLLPAEHDRSFQAMYRRTMPRAVTNPRADA
jgi:MoxR-like ATPase